MNGVVIPGPPPATRPKPRWQALDTLDDRKEIYVTLLSRLHPCNRVRWLEWCCRNSVLPNCRLPPIVGQTTYDLLKATLKEDGDFRLSIDVFQTFWMLTIQHSLDADQALAKLVEMARKQKR